jgi:hypothetical protein
MTDSQQTRIQKNCGFTAHKILVFITPDLTGLGQLFNWHNTQNATVIN